MGVTKFDKVQADEFIGAMTADAGSVGTAELADLGVTAGKLAADAVTTAKILDANVTTAKLADGAVTPAKTINAEARTATADGLTTGIVSDTTTYVIVTSADANNIITLPAPTPGRVVWLNVGATGFELRSSAPATIAINGGSGAGAESAIPANSTILAICISATAWKAIFLDADADVAKVEAAAA